MLNFKEKAFSLIEMIVAITIISLLMSVVAVSVWREKEKAKKARALADIDGIYQAILILGEDTGFWPGKKKPYKTECGASGNEICGDGCSISLSDCEAGLLCNPAPPNDYPNWKGPYLSHLPKDPWGNEYFFDTDYYVDSRCVAVVGSYGPNGVGLNQYDSDDLIKILPTE